MTKYFITGIDTGVGKTVVSAIVTQALEADYWKPIQCGDLHASDTMSVREWVSNERSVFHKEGVAFETPASPHYAASVEKVDLTFSDFVLPETKNTLIIEGAGGLMVPLNYDGDCIVDLISKFDAKAILVSKNYLGSINHTLLSVELLKSRNIPIAGIVFNGEENPETEKVILETTGLEMLFRVPAFSEVNESAVTEFCKSNKELITSGL